MRKKKKEFSSFTNARIRKHPPAAETILMPEKRDIDSNFSCSRKGVSVFSHVRKSSLRDECQDTAVVVLDEGFYLFGVFDGFGKYGTLFSELVARKVIELYDEMKESIIRTLAIETLLKDAAIETKVEMDRMFPDIVKHGGTTAVLAVVLSDRRYSIASVGDSGSFVFGKRGVDRLFDYEKVVEGIGRTIHFTSMKIKEYFNKRNILQHAIGRNGFPEDGLEIISGILQAGEKLMFVTDGMTKNFIHRADRKTEFMEDISGCDDLRELTKRKRNVVSMGRAIVGPVVMRAVGKSHFVGKGNNVILPSDDDAAIIMISVD